MADDLYDYGDYTWGTDPNDPGFYDPNLTTWDPASSYYQGPGSGYAQPAQYSPMDFPAGSGAYQVGSNDWQGVQGYQQPAYQYQGATSGQGFGAPAMGFSPQPSTYQSSGQQSLGGQPYRGPQASGGQRSMAQQTPQQISMGKPEDDLYKRYKSLLMNPDFSGDPSYQFLYNQGLQALNRNLAAQRKTLSGQGMNDTMAYGAGMASKYMQDLLPQYRGGASEELNRFMGPAGLLPSYARTNNAAIGQASNMTDRADMGGGYGGDLGLDRSGFTASAGNGIGWGGVNYPQNRGAQPQATPGYTPRPLSFNENYSPGGQFDPYYTGYDIEGGPAYG